MNKKILLLTLIGVILLFSGCEVNKPLTKQEATTQKATTVKTNFSFPPAYESEYKPIEGTGFKKHVVFENKVYFSLSYKNVSNLLYYEAISFENIEQLNQRTLSDYLIDTLPNRDLSPENDEDYLAELKSKGWQNIVTGEKEIWVQSLFTNLEGYESKGWVLNTSTKEILPVTWTLVDNKNFNPAVNPNYAKTQYEKLVDIMKKVKF